MPIVSALQTPPPPLFIEGVPVGRGALQAQRVGINKTKNNTPHFVWNFCTSGSFLYKRTHASS